MPGGQMTGHGSGGNAAGASGARQLDSSGER